MNLDVTGDARRQQPQHWSEVPNHRSGGLLLGAAAVLVPVIVVSQPLLGNVAGHLILYARSILLPLLLVVLVRRSVDRVSFALLMALVVATGYSGLVDRTQDFLLISVALLSSVVLYRSGVVAAQAPGYEYVWAALVLGVSVVNLVTLGFLAAVAAGQVDLASLYELLQRGDDAGEGLARFALGNAIEIPFCTSAVLFAAMQHAPRNRSYPIAASLNLLTAFISQSRIVILIGVVIFVIQWLRSPPLVRAASLAVVVAAMAWQRDLIAPVIESVIGRFTGEDRGSGADRVFLTATVLGALEPQSLLLGNGLTAAAEHIRQVTGVYRTVESLLLQLTFEIGAVGIALLWMALRLDLPAHAQPPISSRAVSLLLWVELLFYLPVTNLAPIEAFALGALTVGRAEHRREAAGASAGSVMTAQ